MCTSSCPIHPRGEPQGWAEVPAPKQLPDHSSYEQDNQCGQHRTKSKDSKRDTAKGGNKRSSDLFNQSLEKGHKAGFKGLARKVWHTQEVAVKGNPMKDALGNQQQRRSHLLWYKCKNPLQTLGRRVPNGRVASRIQRKSLWSMVEDEAVLLWQMT